MNKQELLSLAVSSFLFRDIQNGRPIMPLPASTTEFSVSIDCSSVLYVSHKEKPLSKEEEAVFSRLEDVWGDDEDGEYENLYQHHQNLKSHAL